MMRGGMAKRRNNDLLGNGSKFVTKQLTDNNQ